MRWKKNMDALDFSKFKDILLEDEDGGIQPMSQPYFKAKEIALRNVAGTSQVTIPM